jgi:short-subunit dehydrogenase
MQKQGDIRNLIREVQDKFGQIDILVNNAGQGLLSSVEAVDLDEYRGIMELNVSAVLSAMQQVIPIMCKHGRGTILNVSSMVSKNTFPMLAAYASIKYALNALSLTARQELAKDNNVSVFHPKMTATDFGKNARGEKYDSHAGRPGRSVDTPEAVAERIADQIVSGDAEAQM